MRRDKLPLSTIHTLAITLLTSLPDLHPPAQRRGRPCEYEDASAWWKAYDASHCATPRHTTNSRRFPPVLTLWLYQTLHQLSSTARCSVLSSSAAFRCPRCEQLPRASAGLELLRRLVEAAGKLMLEQKQCRCKRLIADDTGFGYGQKYLLMWMRASQLRQVRSHGRLVILLAVDETAQAVVVVCCCGGPYSSEVRLLAGGLRRLEKLPAVPLLADRGLMQWARCSG